MRQMFRVGPGPDVPFAVAVRTKDGTTRGRLIEVSVEEARVKFAKDPALGVGEILELLFAGSGRFRHQAEGLVRSRAHGGTYTFSFVNVERQEREFLPRLNLAFNRREYFRLHRDPHTPMRVRLGVGEKSSWTGTVVDLSAGGMALYVDSDVERALRKIDDLRTWMWLPRFSGGREQLEFRASLRFRAFTRPLVRYGLQFVDDGAPGFSGQVTAIADYVQRMQQARRPDRVGEESALAAVK